MKTSYAVSSPKVSFTICLEGQLFWLNQAGGKNIQKKQL